MKPEGPHQFHRSAKRYNGMRRKLQAKEGVTLVEWEGNDASESYQNTDIAKQGLSSFVKDAADLVFEILGSHCGASMSS